jgi:hypothetical protein
MVIGGRLWRQIPSTCGWYTVDEVEPGLYAYRHSDDPAQDEHSLAGASRSESEPEGLERTQGCVGPTHGQEGDGISNRVESVAVPGGGIGFLAARDVKPTGEGQ